MGFLSKTSEILFRGALASYFLLYAININQRPFHLQPIIVQNLTYYAQSFGASIDQIDQFVSKWISVYCQWLVFASLMVVSGLRSGRLLSSIALIVNLGLCWSQSQILFLGIQLIMLVSTFR